MKNKVLVTGGAGFIGYHVVKRLLTINFEVVVIDNFSTGLRRNLHPDAKLIEMDILDEKLPLVFSKEKFDYVIHLAAQTSVTCSLLNPANDCRINIDGTVNILEACRRTGVKRVVFASSAAVYGNLDEIPLKENVPLQPLSFYGLSKLTAERYLEIYNKTFGLNYVVLRFANVYGPRQGDTGEGGVVGIFVRKIKNAQPLEIFGDGGQTRDFIYVGDVAAANCDALLASRDVMNQAYNISTKNQTSVNKLSGLLAKIAGRETAIVYSPPREGDIYHSMLDNTLAVSNLGWWPEVDLAKGLSRTYLDLTEKN